MSAEHLILALILGLLGLAIAEVVTHRRNLRCIPIRIHVNGSRGKSSVTRLIAAGLNEGGIPTCAKTTGTLPRMIFPDGRELPVFRASSANIIEQLRIVAATASTNAQALVVECMALQPELQWLSEGQLLRATHGVVTNVRPDHLEVMGPNEGSVAWALAGMVPQGGRLFTGESRHLPIFAAAAADRHSTLVTVGAADVAAISPAIMARFSYTEHTENVALALRVCEDLGVPRDTALAGMWQAASDPGAMTEHEINFFGRRLVFVNGFAANDPVSTETIWQLAVSKYSDRARRIVIFNCRSDRPTRSLQLAQAYVKWPAADHVVLMGTGTYLFARAATRAGLDAAKLVFVESQRVEEIFETVVGLAGRSALVMGMGNIGGYGLDLVRCFRNRSILPEEA